MSEGAMYAEEAGPFIITNDARTFFHGRYTTPEELEAGLQEWAAHGYFRWEQVPPDRWGELERRHYMNTAGQCFRHDHPGYIAHDREERIMVRDNCGACALEGWDMEAERFRKSSAGPNYGGWARVYVEAGRTIPAIWHYAFEHDQRHGDNERYSDALELSIATFGARFDDGLRLERLP